MRAQVRVDVLLVLADRVWRVYPVESRANCHGWSGEAAGPVYSFAFDRFRPGAFGLPIRGDGSLARLCLTFMTHLNFPPGEFLVAKSPSNDMTHDKHKALNIALVPVVVAKRLFVYVAEQMK
jgi:hypothetical protein